MQVDLSLSKHGSPEDHVSMHKFAQVEFCPFKVEF